MPKASYHPVCVLYQGNDSPYDGTYQLICRHQIKERDFQPGDVVQVLPDPLQTNGPSVPFREAIALGDDMIVGLLGNFCSSFSKPKRPQTQSAGCSSSNSDDGPPSKKRLASQGESRNLVDPLSTKTSKQLSTWQRSFTLHVIPPPVYYDNILQVKQNLLESTSMKVETTSASSPQESSCENSDGAMGEISSAINMIRAQNQSILNAIHVMKQQQVSFQQELVVIKETLQKMGNGQPSISSAVHPPQMNYIEMEDVPSQVGLRPPVIPSPVTSAEVTGSPAMSGDSKDECPQYLTSPIMMDPPMQQEAFEGDVKEEDYQSTAPSTIAPNSYQYHTYPHYANFNKQYNYHFTDDKNTTVYIGGPEFDRRISKLELDQMILKTATPTSFSYRLASRLFTTEEMLKGNTSGIGVAKTGIHFDKLDNITLAAILAEVENRFPGARTTHEGDKRLLSAINDCCRNRRKRTLYNKMKVVADVPGQSGVSQIQTKCNKKEPTE